MIEAEPWSYHVDGSPVYSLADILADRDQRSSQVARALRRKGLPTGGVRPGEKAAPDETAIILYASGATGMLLALPEARTADWSALSYVVYGASPIPLPVLRDATEIIGCSFLQFYGLTESTSGFTLLGPGDHVPAEEFAHRLRSAGRPMRGARSALSTPSRWRIARPGSAARSWWPARAS